MSQQLPYGITYRVTRMEDGRTRAEVKVRQEYHDDVALQLPDADAEPPDKGIKQMTLEYSGKMIWDEDEADRQRIEQDIRRDVLHGFDHVPRPIAVRVVYAGDGLGPDETRFTVNEFIPEGEG